ncbi:2TM domain-containing protein [Hydrogenophaga sp. PAMC20947]|uniref:2TM domain-containing protein n=1 Tax=Hydrogenophaga sp. PAMC20947 TaxID=2565558 RepID=UPI00109DD19B|nr:2TM domain-containing protein [Hydrogenophaga sp. PAMC20947]QCB46267.1 2TM domain-containing protein [Hydrogenophaga sp. PAMC20947]
MNTQPSFAQSAPLSAPLSAHHIEALATRRVKAKLGWYHHATVYACVIGGLALIGLWQGRAWPLAPALGWGLGLAVHAFVAFGPRFGESMKAKMLQTERERLMNRH